MINMCPEITKSAQPGLIMIADDALKSVKSADLTFPVPVPYVDNSVIDGEFNLSNCADIHIGPKYEHSGDIVIHQNIYSKSQDDLRSLQDCRTSWPTIQRCFEGKVHCCYLNCKVVTLTSTAAVMSLVVFASILLIYIGFFKEVEPVPSNDNIRVLSASSKELEEQYPLEKQFVLRDTWGAAQPTKKGILNKLPVERVILIHTVGAGTCNKFTSCKQQVLQIQELHMNPDHDYGDIGYNFVIGSDGYIYVGVGWDKVGAHTYGYNRDSLGVAFVGDFRFDEPNSLMMSSLQRLLDFGVEIKKLSKHFQLYGHCQLHHSFPLSPGKNIMSIVKTWPHWNNTNADRCK